jgi:anti-sigma factor RsiW
MSHHRLPPATVSEYDLNAWIDGELVEPERSEVAAAVTACPELTSRACALQTLKGLLQLAYDPDSTRYPGTAMRQDKTGSHD